MNSIICTVRIVCNRSSRVDVVPFSFAEDLYSLAQTVDNLEVDSEFKDRILRGELVKTKNYIFIMDNPIVEEIDKPGINLKNINTIVAIDFDGVIIKDSGFDLTVEGKELVLNEGFMDFYKEMRDLNVSLILWTCRAGKRLVEAVNFLTARGIFFDAINEDVPIIEESFNIKSRKIFAHVYIDDNNEGGFKGFIRAERKVRKIVKTRN